MERISLSPPRPLSYRITEWFIRRQFGAMLDPVRATAHNMPVTRAFGALEQRAARWSALEVNIRDLADMAAAAKIGCSWCLDFGYWMMHTHGISREKIEAVAKWRSSNLFSPIERLAMEYAEALTDTPPTVNDELVSKLRNHLDEAQLVELTAIICLENLRSRRNIAFGVTAQRFKARCDFAQPSERQAEQARVQAEHGRAT
jgi:AhpD family alkylhydroperoxidase